LSDFEGVVDGVAGQRSGEVAVARALLDAPHRPHQILLLNTEPDRTSTHLSLHTPHHRLPEVMRCPVETKFVP
jgi:hypothetical protein